MPKAQRVLSSDEMKAELESVLGEFDWIFDPGDDEATIVRKTYSAYAPTMAAHRAGDLQALMADFAPNGMAPWRAIVTAEGVTFRQG